VSLEKQLVAPFKNAANLGKFFTVGRKGLTGLILGRAITKREPGGKPRPLQQRGKKTLKGQNGLTDKSRRCSTQGGVLSSRTASANLESG